MERVKKNLIKKNHLSVVPLVFLCNVLILIVIFSACTQPEKIEMPEKSLSAYGRFDAWRIIGIGGGGAMFNPAVSPFNPDFASVSCDMGGSYITYDGGNQWRMMNLDAMTRFWVFDPVDSNTIYASALGLFKSTDKGRTWKLFYPRPEDVGGKISKGDHGDFVLFTRDSSRRRVTAFAIDPENNSNLYTAISIDDSLAVYSSPDAGQSWKKEWEADATVKNIFIDPSSPSATRTLYVSTESGIAVRNNGQWKKNPLPTSVSRLTTITGGYSGSEKKFILYAITGKSYFNSAGDSSGIFFSDNGGQTWENRQSGLTALKKVKGAEDPEWRTIATGSRNPEVVYVSYNNLHVHPDTVYFGVAKSSDFGKTWQLSWKDAYIKGKTVNDPNVKDGWLSERFDASWGENPFSMYIAPSNPDVCYATDFGRTLKTVNGGQTWEQVYTRQSPNGNWTSRGLDVTTAYSIVFDPYDSNHVFIPTTDIGLMESRDGGQAWKSATEKNGVPRDWVNTTYWMVFDPEVKGRAWAVMSGDHDLPRPKMWRNRKISTYTGGILITGDAGKTWTPVSSQIGEAAMTHILMDPASPVENRILYACAFGKGVYKSVDGGKTWVQKNNGLPATEPFAWQITRRDRDGALFLVVSRRSEDGSIGNDLDGSVYRSDDGAESWTKIALPEGCNGPTTIALDPDHPEKIILSAWGRKTSGKLTSDKDGGIFISDDAGKTWKHVFDRDQHVGAITYDKRNKRFYACGFNAAAWYSDDQGLNWKKIRGYDFKWGQRVESDPKDPEKVYVITYGGGVWHGPVISDE